MRCRTSPRDGIRTTTSSRMCRRNSATIAAAMVAEFLLHILEEVVVRIPSLGDVLHLIAGLLYQRTPDVVYPSALIIRYQIAAALFFYIVVAVGRRQRGGCELVS